MEANTIPPKCRSCNNDMFGGGKVHDNYWECTHCSSNEKFDEMTNEYFQSSYKENSESREKFEFQLETKKEEIDLDYVHTATFTMQALSLAVKSKKYQEMFNKFLTELKQQPSPNANKRTV